MAACQTLINADYIITQNEAREVLENGGIAINDGQIVAIGPWSDLDETWQPQEYLDLSGHLVMPGLINAHTHAAMTFLRGLADDLPLMEWLNKTVFPVEARLTYEITCLASLLGYAEMLATGTTACIDMYIFEAAVFEAAEISGIRCMGGEAIFQFPSAAFNRHEDALEETRRLAEMYAGHPRISVAVNPHSVYTTTSQILHSCSQLAQELDLPIHIHLAESAGETAQCLALHGKRPVEYCQKAGLLSEKLIAAHLVDITGEEAELLANADAKGVHNPSSNMKLASGAAPLDQLLAAGMMPGLGTDGPASNNQLNMFQEMARAALLQKLALQKPDAAPAGQMLDMATLGGAACMGNPFIGQLAPGCEADLVALDLSRPNMQPLHNPISQAVYAASGHEVDLTMIQGEIVYRDGEFTHFNYGALLKEIKSLRDFARSKA